MGTNYHLAYIFSIDKGSRMRATARRLGIAKDTVTDELGVSKG
jgi:hypothetical protein